MDREAQRIELQQRIEDLQRQSKILKLESELDGYEQMLGDGSLHQPMSTPMSGKYDMPSGPGKLLFDIPPGRPAWDKGRMGHSCQTMTGLTSM